MPPAWLLDGKDVCVIEAYEAEVVGESGEGYSVEFTDHDGLGVEATLAKGEFEGFPSPVGEGTLFNVVVYHRRGQPKPTAAAWPLAKSWNPSLREPLDDRFNALADEWEEWSKYRSCCHDRHPAVGKIVEMGWSAIPLIVGRLRQEEGCHWVLFLAKITNEAIVPEAMRGRMREMRDLWLRWVEERGLSGP